MRRLSRSESKRDRKQSLRNKLIQRRRRLSDKNQKDALIQKTVLNSPPYLDCDLLMVYVSKDEEAATNKLLEHAVANKDVYVPVTVQHPQPEKRELQISQVESQEQLRQGSFRVAEPRHPDFEDNLKSKITPELLIVPGVAFSENKHRLGYGSGYFDKYLSSVPPESTIIGLAYEQQILEDLPVEKHDVPVDVVVTEQRIIG